MSNLREERKKQRSKMLDKMNDKKEVLTTHGAFVTSRKMVKKNPVELHEQELMTLFWKSKRPMHSDEEIGKMFREIFSD